MCGICGIYAPGRIGPDVLRRMNDTLLHRGPDDEGYYVDDDVGLGSRRLSVIDLFAGRMPLHNEDGSVWVVQNGEIYNHLDIRRELLAKGHRFTTNSDTEALVHLYEEVGEKLFERLRGMFAIALWDRRHRRLLLGRDRFGKKPLYYAWDGQRLVFGSEIKAVREAGDLRLSLDLEAVNDYFSYLYIPEPRSIFREIRKLPAAHYLKIENGQLTTQCYWVLNYESPSAETNEEHYLERLRELLLDSVRCRLMSDVPLGAFLSGGIDSSSIVAMMTQITNKPVKTFSIGFDDRDYDELKYARRVAQLFQSDHHEEIVKPVAEDLLEQLTYYYDEPFGDSSALPTYLVSQMARREVTVALCGDGGDEAFAGYDAEAVHLRDENFHQRIPGPLRWAAATSLTAAGRVSRNAKLARIAAAVTRANTPMAERYSHVFTKRQRQQLYSAELRQAMGPMREEALFESQFASQRFPDTLSQILYADTRVFLVSDILAKVDRASMAHSLEVRTPLVDYLLYEYVATIPSSLKLHRGISKYIFKKAVEAWLPPDIVHRKKHGFGVPVAAWFRNELHDMLYDHLLGSQDGCSGLFHRPFIEKLLREHSRAERDWSFQLWPLLVFGLWYRRWAP